jgi:hypothetical protein
MSASCFSPADFRLLDRVVSAASAADVLSSAAESESGLTSSCVTRLATTTLETKEAHKAFMVALRRRQRSGPNGRECRALLRAGFRPALSATALADVQSHVTSDARTSAASNPGSDDDSAPGIDDSDDDDDDDDLHDKLTPRMVCNDKMMLQRALISLLQRRPDAIYTFWAVPSLRLMKSAVRLLRIDPALYLVDIRPFYSADGTLCQSLTMRRSGDSAVAYATLLKKHCAVVLNDLTANREAPWYNTRSRTVKRARFLSVFV